MSPFLFSFRTVQTVEDVERMIRQQAIKTFHVKHSPFHFTAVINISERYACLCEYVKKNPQIVGQSEEMSSGQTVYTAIHFKHFLVPLMLLHC